MLSTHIVWADAEEDREYRLKTAFLFNFTKFIQWPEAKWAQWSSADFCFVGVRRFASVIDESMSGKMVRNKSVVSRYLTPAEDFQSCGTVFIGEGAYSISRHLLPGLVAQGSLVVGEHDEFLESGGMINFYVERNKLRFQVNLEAVSDAELVISSKLLGLAQIVNYPVPRGQ